MIIEEIKPPYNTDCIKKCFFIPKAVHLLVSLESKTNLRKGIDVVHFCADIGGENSYSIITGNTTSYINPVVIPSNKFWMLFKIGDNYPSNGYGLGIRIEAVNYTSILMDKTNDKMYANVLLNWFVEICPNRAVTACLGFVLEKITLDIPIKEKITLITTARKLVSNARTSTISTEVRNGSKISEIFGILNALYDKEANDSHSLYFNRIFEMVLSVDLKPHINVIL